jgi:hypothetical protein
MLGFSLLQLVTSELEAIDIPEAQSSNHYLVHSMFRLHDMALLVCASPDQVCFYLGSPS